MTSKSFLCIVLSGLWCGISTPASAQVWSQIMNLNSGSSSESGSVFREYKNCCTSVPGQPDAQFIASPWGNYPDEYASTYSYPTLMTPRDSGGSNAAYWGGAQCNSSTGGVCVYYPFSNPGYEASYDRDPQQTLESSYLYDPFFGLSFQGTFNRGYANWAQPGGNGILAVFVHQQYFYDGGNEYGFAYDYDRDLLTLYISNNTNLGYEHVLEAPLHTSSSWWPLAATNYYNVWFTCNPTCMINYSVQDQYYNFLVPPTALSASDIEGQVSACAMNSNNCNGFQANPYYTTRTLSESEVETLLQSASSTAGYVSAAAQHLGEMAGDVVETSFNLGITAIKVAK